MKKPPSARIASYLLVAFLGAAGGWLVKRGGEGQGHRNAAGSQENAVPKDGKEFLATFVAASAPVITFDENLEAMRKSMAVSADPAADFQKRFVALEHFFTGLPDDDPRMLELAVALGQWMDADPKAALGFLSAGYSGGGLTGKLADTYLWRIAKRVVAENGVRDFLSAMPENRDLIGITSRSVFEEVGKRASLADLEWLKTNAPWFFTDGSEGRNLAREWPLERRDELLAQLDPASAAAAVAWMTGRMDGGGEWIVQQLKDGAFAPEVVNAMADGDLGQYFRSINGVSIEQRLEIIGLLGAFGNMGEDRVKNEMIFNSIRNRFFGRETDDSLYGLRHGTLTAAEVVERAQETMPDPGKHAGEFNSQMFRTLAEENLPAAMQMLSGMPPQQQEQEKALAARWWFRDADPDDFYNLVRDLNATGNDSTKAMMQDAWNDKARGHIGRYGEAYLDWIKALPDGVDKTQALRSVVAAGGNARLAAQARNLLSSK
jgi:hypothetical protein